MLSKEKYKKLVEARNSLCEFCECCECDKCIVTRLLDDAQNEYERGNKRFLDAADILCSECDEHKNICPSCPVNKRLDKINNRENGPKMDLLPECAL